MFKPAYGQFPGGAILPGLERRTAADGKTSEYPLKELQTFEERRKNLSQGPNILHHDTAVFSRWYEYMPYYFKLYNQERQAIGLEEIRPIGGRR